MGHKLRKPVMLAELSEALGLAMTGEDTCVREVSAFDDAVADSLTFCKGKDAGARPCIAITDAEASGGAGARAPRLLSDNPRLDFVRALQHLSRVSGFATFDFESKIHDSVVLGESVVVERGCEIAANVTIGNNVTLQSGTRIGEGSSIGSGSIIGADGFGFSRLPDGRPLKFIQLGGVSIGKDVEIGTHNCICRGTLGDTTLADSVKTAHAVRVSHNCRVAEQVLIAAFANINGGVKVERDAYVGANVAIKEKVTIGSGAIVGIGAVVISDVPAKSVFAGNPARFLRDA